MAALPRQYRRDFTSVCMNIKVFIKPIQNAHILTCMLRFRIALLRASLIINLPFQQLADENLADAGIILNPAELAASRSKRKDRNH